MSDRGPHYVHVQDLRAPEAPALVNFAPPIIHEIFPAAMMNPNMPYVGYTTIQTSAAPPHSPPGMVWGPFGLIPVYNPRVYGPLGGPSAYPSYVQPAPYVSPTGVMGE